MRIVIDTNVLVSGMINSQSYPGKVLDFVRAGAIEMIVDDRILEEYVDVLQRDYLRTYFSLADVHAVLGFIIHRAYHVACDVVVDTLPDAGDVCFLEVALTVDAPLITGNKRHFPLAKRRDADVLNPREFIIRYAENQR